MKKIIQLVFLIVFLLSASSAFAIDAKSKIKLGNSKVPDKKENKLSDEEISRMTNRLNEIHYLNKTSLPISEKRALRKEARGIKENVRKDDIYVISGTTLFIIILICICL